MNPPEARYQLRWGDAHLTGTQTMRTLFATARCGCRNGSCGDVLAMVVLSSFEPLQWAVWVRRGYSQRPPLSESWMWSRHARRSPRGSPDHAPRWGTGIITASGDVVIHDTWTAPTRRTVVLRAEAGFARDNKRIAVLCSPDWPSPGLKLLQDRRDRSGLLWTPAVTLGCQRESPHLSTITWDVLKREAIIDPRLIPA